MTRLPTTIALVTGSREPSVALLRKLHEVLAELPSGTWILTGGALGIDEGADCCARTSDHLQPMPPMFAPWGDYGRGAGPRRNKRMVDHLADYRWCGYDVRALAFPMHPEGQGSKGTWGCVRLALERGIPCRIYRGGAD